MKASVSECIERAIKNGREELIPVIERMAGTQESISDDEGIEVWDD